MLSVYSWEVALRIAGSGLGIGSIITYISGVPCKSKYPPRDQGLKDGDCVIANADERKHWVVMVVQQTGFLFQLPDPI